MMPFTLRRPMVVHGTFEIYDTIIVGTYIDTIHWGWKIETSDILDNGEHIVQASSMRGSQFMVKLLKENYT